MMKDHDLPVLGAYSPAAASERPAFTPDATERLHRDELTARQGQRLSEMLTRIYGRNAFYTRKLDAAGVDVDGLRLLDDLTRLPMTTKAELVADQEAHPPWGSALTEPLDRYTRYCQTSSTTGRPLRWIDTGESWQWMLECWKTVYRGARVAPGDRVFFPFSFGPFLGFWAGFEAGCQMGLHCIPGGGMPSAHPAHDDRGGRGHRDLLHADLRA